MPSSKTPSLKKPSSNTNGTGKSNGRAPKRFDEMSSKQLLRALHAFEQGDFSVSDTVNARQLLKALRAYKRGNLRYACQKIKSGSPVKSPRPLMIVCLVMKRYSKNFLESDTQQANKAS